MKKQLEGIVVSTKMEKTALIKVVRTYRHPVVKKIIARAKQYKASTGGLKVVDGTRVVIEECRPKSKDVHFIIKRILSK